MHERPGQRHDFLEGGRRGVGREETRATPIPLVMRVRVRTA